MIRAVGAPGAPLPRLLAAVGSAAEARASTATILVLGPVRPDTAADSSLALALERELTAAGPSAEPRRLLVVTPLGTHRDSPVPVLRRSWDLEEAARATGLPTLTLRLGPLVGPGTPLWRRLRSRPRLPSAGRHLLSPVHERDVIRTLEIAFRGDVVWEGWYEVVGPEVVSLAELAALAAEAGPRLPAGAGAWEPELAVLQAQRLAECRPWAAHFGIEPRRLRTLLEAPA